MKKQMDNKGTQQRAAQNGTRGRTSGYQSEKINKNRSTRQEGQESDRQGGKRRTNAARSRAARERYKKRKRKILRMQISLLLCSVAILGLLVLVVKQLVSKDDTTVVQASIEEEIKSVLTEVTDDTVAVSKYYVYGTHLNLEGTVTATKEVQTLALVLVDETQGAQDSTEQASGELQFENSYTLSKTVAEDGTYGFQTGENINEGINLEHISNGNYCMLLKLTYVDGSTEYKSLNNAASEEDITYYTLTDKGSNQKIDISFAKDSGSTNLNYLQFNVAKTSLPDDVYDIVVDAGHGGKDPGSDSDGYTEAELTLKYAKALKESLEDIGLKVKLSRDGSEAADSNMAYNMYDEDGRVSITCRSKAKYCICIHLNSNTEQLTKGGVEIYSTIKGNADFAKLVADHVVTEAGTDYSNKESEKVADGVYQAPYSESGIEKNVATAEKQGYEAYGYEGVDSLFMIREVGGIATGAFVDGRDTRYGTNEYRDSNVGVETLLVELGYISQDEDLKNLISNQAGYVKGMTDAVEEQLAAVKAE